MKNRSNWAVLGILFCQLLWPGLKLFSQLTPLEFYFRSELVYLLLISAVTVGLCLYVYKQDNAPSKWLCLILLPASIVSGALEVFFNAVFAIPLSALNCICAAFLYSQFLPDRWYKYLTSTVCILITMVYLYLFGISLIFGQLGTQRVVQEAASPEGLKSAQLIDDDQGALGGNTFVYVRYRDILPLGFGGIRPDSTLVYRGRWGEFENLSLSWMDEKTLLVGDIPFSIP